MPYGFVTWEDKESFGQFVGSCGDFESMLYYKSVKFDNGERTVFFFPTRLSMEATNFFKKLDIENYEISEDPEPISGLLLQ